MAKIKKTTVVKKKNKKPLTKAALAKLKKANKPTIKKQKKQPWELSYKEEFAMVGYELALLGFTYEKLAEVFCVPIGHVKKWQANIENFRASLFTGRELADAKVAKALYQRAIGYTHKEEKIHFDKFGDVFTYDTLKHYPPDAVAARFWLELRQKDLWKGADDLNLNLNEMIPWGHIKSGIDK